MNNMENKNTETKTRTRTLIGRLWTEANEHGKYLSGSLDLDMLKTLETSQIRITVSKTKEKRQETSPDALVFGYLDVNEKKEVRESCEAEKKELL